MFGGGLAVAARVTCLTLLPLVATLGDSFVRRVQFRRGDANADGAVNVADPIFVLNALFAESRRGTCVEAANANDDDGVDISDALYLLGHLFGDLPPPAPPGPVACGVDRNSGYLGCSKYELCPDDTALIAHALRRITFGPNEELLARIQTRADLERYIEDQLRPPVDYDPVGHEPELAQRIDRLRIGFRDPVSGAPIERLEAMLIENARSSRWQLLHVLALFWNNHFHTQITTLRDLFFGRMRRGGVAARGSAELFRHVDGDGSGTIDAGEWSEFRAAHPGVRSFAEFGRSTADGTLSPAEFEFAPVAYWKYGTGAAQLAVAADMERREYEYFRRHALGSFADLVEGSAKSVAMLIYLNGFENTAAAPNENYAREVLELSTLGVDHLYTQRDIEELSRILTGWTVAWVERRHFFPHDIGFHDQPDLPRFPIDGREPRPFAFPARANWDDGTYVWAFAFGHPGLRDGGHDWGRKDLFLPRYGGVDSLGNPVPPRAALTIPANEDQRTPERAVEEFDLVLRRIAHFRDTAKFVGTKLIQLFVTDDLSALPRTYPLRAELAAHFESVDSDGDGLLDLDEWEMPIPLVLPNGRPLAVFRRLDTNADERISPREYQEPDLLVDVIDAWAHSNGDLREVVRTILRSDEFLSLEYACAKVKTPLETIVSAVRALDGGLSVNDGIRASRELTLAGMELFEFADPTGESELGFDWMHTIGLLERLKYLSRGIHPGSPADRRFVWNPLSFQRQWALDSGERVVEFFALLLHGQALPVEHRELALEIYREAGAVDRVRAVTAFLASLPQFQLQ